MNLQRLSEHIGSGEPDAAVVGVVGVARGEEAVVEAQREAQMLCHLHTQIGADADIEWIEAAVMVAEFVLHLDKDQTYVRAGFCIKSEIVAEVDGVTCHHGDLQIKMRHLPCIVRAACAQCQPALAHQVQVREEDRHAGVDSAFQLEGNFMLAVTVLERVEAEAAGGCKPELVVIRIFLVFILLL